MPTYDYLCGECGHTFEEFQSIKDFPKKKCPQCKKLKLKRLLGTGAGVIFKGSGFYQTDYRSDGYKKAAESEKPAPAKSETKSDTAAPSGDAKKETPANTPKENKKTA